jgi:hypothetical protein
MECYFRRLVLEMDDLGIDHCDFEILDAIDAAIAIDASERVAFCIMVLVVRVLVVLGVSVRVYI